MDKMEFYLFDCAIELGLIGIHDWFKIWFVLVVLGIEIEDDFC